MNRLETSDIIYLTYITNYDIGLMYRAMEEQSNRDSIFSYCIDKMRLSNKDNSQIIEKTKIAIQKLKYHRIKTVSVFDEYYPENLKAIKDAPPVLYIKGELRKTKNAAVVGSRDISDFAESNTHKVSKWLHDEEFSIVSGLAEGIDTLAHQYAINNKIYTIAVLPNSLDSIYPKSNYGLAVDILNSGGCLVSETLFNINRGKRSFVQRNRIQSALSDIVIPIEMGTNSGTMHTINFAKRYGKKILVSKVANECMSMKQYSGIQNIISKPSKNIYIYENEISFKNAISKKDNEQTEIKFE
jgi:DNA processing protein